jgi:hypothetical protein
MGTQPERGVVSGFGNKSCVSCQATSDLCLQFPQTSPVLLGLTGVGFGLRIPPVTAPSFPKFLRVGPSLCKY